MANYATDATYVDGIMRWKSNDRVPPEEYVADAIREGFPADAAKCDAARSVDLKAFLAVYRMEQAQRTPEQIAEQRMEARAAMGEGVKMVNIITGEKYTT